MKTTSAIAAIPLALKPLSLAISSGVALTTLAFSSFPANAQTPAQPRACVSEAVIREDNTVSVNLELSRAKSLARQAAERANGGLGNYRAEASMYGPVSESPCVDNNDGTWTFIFQGGSPGFTVPTVESVVTVAKDISNVTVEYNGPIRPTSGNFQPPRRQDEGNLTLVPGVDPRLPRALNLARQAAERANGGLGNYRAEASMYSAASQAPVVDNGDTWTFTFRGGPPGSPTLTTESVVTVAKDASYVMVNYNGSIRSQP